jgi:TPR repeat protein
MATRGHSKDKRKFNETLKEALIGAPEAQYEVGLMYANGIGVQGDTAQAVDWIQKSAQRGYVPAQYLLGTLLASGTDLEKDEARALHWLTKAAERDHAKATHRLAKLLATAHEPLANAYLQRAAKMGVAEAQWSMGQVAALQSKDPLAKADALQWLEKAAAQGLAAAQYGMGQAFEHGLGTPQNIDQAVSWYFKAAEQDFPAAFVALHRLAADTAGSRRAQQGAAKKAHEKPIPVPKRAWEQVPDPGDAESRYHLGLMYQFAMGVPLDITKAEAWYLLAARQGDVRAQLALAKLHEEAGEKSALDWYLKAAEQGSADAQFAAGRLLSSGLGNLDVQSLAGTAWYIRAAQQGDPRALLTLGHLFSGSLDNLAADCFLKAAEQGFAEAQFALAQQFDTGKGVTKDATQAFQWFLSAARQADPQAQLQVGLRCLSGRGTEINLHEAIHWLRLAAESGVAKAQWNLGALYASGAENLERDLKLAFDWCQKAAEQAFVPAQATLGVIYALTGHHEKALLYWAQAAEAGDAEAQYNLALMFAKGTVVTKDPAKAFDYFLKAACQGLAQAQGRVGLMYAQGDGVPHDPIEAHKWFEIASRSGDIPSKANLERSRKLLAPAHLAEAIRRSQLIEVK